MIHKKIQIPNFLNDVLGSEQSVMSITLILLFALASSLFTYFHFISDFKFLAPWRQGLALLLVFDIYAGAVANFSKGTSSYYAKRPGHRWVFITIHFHIIIFALLMNASLINSVIVWAITIIFGVGVNLLYKSSHQKMIAGFFMCVGLILFTLLGGDSGVMNIVSQIFFVKVVYSFGVNHYLD